MKRLILILTVIVLIFGCTKKFDSDTYTSPPDNIVYTIEGRFMKECGIPWEGINLSLIQNPTTTPTFGTGPATSNKDGGLLDVSHTDSDGRFKFEFKLLNGKGLLSVNGLGSMAMGWIPIKTNINDLDIYSFPSVNLTVRLKALRNYTVKDTLGYWLYNYEKEKWVDTIMVGPFIDGQILVYTEGYNNFSLEGTYGGRKSTISYTINKVKNSFEFYSTRFCKDTTVYIEL